MSKANGFLQLRRGIWEHVRDGSISPTQALALIYCMSEADTRTGIWKGSAKSLSVELGIPERTARDALEKLERSKYIRRFTVPGRHACYPILVHNFLITTGKHVGELLNAAESKSPDDLGYFPREQNGERGVEHGAAQKRKRIEKETEIKAAAKTTPPSDERFQPFFKFAYETFHTRNGQKPAWRGKDQKALKLFLEDQPHVSTEEFSRRYRHFLDSTDHFFRQQGGSLAFFLSNFDKFLSGPILSKGALVVGDGQGNGLESFTERRRRENAEAFREVHADIDHLD